MKTVLAVLAGVGIALGSASPAFAQTHAPWPSDWNNWSDPALWVTVGNPGNAGELSGYSASRTERICGAVDYECRIGKYEVTAGQYTEFLNAIAGVDTYGLYNTNMDTAVNSYGCNIKRSGSGTQGDPYTYGVAAEWANRPVNYVSWGDAARFVNWLTNGQPTGPQDLTTTEDGSYYLNGALTDSELLVVTRKANARYAIPSEDEWYKAAYYSGSGDVYYDYATGTDSVPSNVLGSPTDPGNNATFWVSGYTVGSPHYRTEAGTHENSESPYGTFDQGGNVWEWNEAVLCVSGWSTRGLRGGSFKMSAFYMNAGHRGYDDPTDEVNADGFRIVVVPEPGSAALLVFCALGLVRRRRRA